MFEFQSVPLVLYGQEITPDLLPANAVGGHTGIMPTLVELIAPQGFAYNSVAPPLGQYPATFNRDYYLTDSLMGQIDTDKTEALPDTTKGNDEAERAKLEPFLHKLRTISYWLIKENNH